MEFLAQLLLAAFDLDERPGAQKFTWGCMVVLVRMLVAVLVWQNRR